MAWGEPGTFPVGCNPTRITIMQAAKQESRSSLRLWARRASCGACGSVWASCVWGHGARGGPRAGTGFSQVALPVKKNSEKQHLQPSFLWILFPFYSPFEGALTLGLPSPPTQHSSGQSSKPASKGQMAFGVTHVTLKAPCRMRGVTPSLYRQ